MKLINTTSLLITEFTASSVPKYATLSHTWEDNEISYQEYISPNPETYNKQGYHKIQKACSLAKSEDIEYVWVDTCCIDKTSSAELSEAINSMFNWYARGKTCYVYLSDLDETSVTPANLAHCRWFTRGWTLQELIAPKNVEFYNQKWYHIGSKLSYARTVSVLTNIDINLLRNLTLVTEYSVATRMSWAARRMTTRIEDRAYSLFGIFEVNLPLLYGEEHKAFRRLQEEIIRTTDDLTIFAWMDDLSSFESAPRVWSKDLPGMNLLAPVPDAFKAVPQAGLSPDRFAVADLSISSKRLFMAGRASFAVIRHNDSTSSYVLWLGTHLSYNPSRTIRLGICLRKIGPQSYCRSRNTLVEIDTVEVPARTVTHYGVRDLYIIANVSRDLSMQYIENRTATLHVPDQTHWTRLSVSPTQLWDEECQVFLHGNNQHALKMALFGGNFEGEQVAICVVCPSHSSSDINCTVFIEDEATEALIHKIFDTDRAIEGIDFSDLPPGIQDPMYQSGHHTHFRANGILYEVSVGFREVTFSNEFCKVKLYELVLETTKVQ